MHFGVYISIIPKTNSIMSSSLLPRFLPPRWKQAPLLPHPGTASVFRAVRDAHGSPTQAACMGAGTPHGILADPRQPLVSSSNTPSCPYAASLTRQTLRFSFQTPYFPSRTSSPFLYRFHIFSTHQVAKVHDFRVNKSEITAAKSTKKDKIFAKSFSYP